MESIYYWAIIFAILAVYFGLCWLMPHINPVWIYKQKRLLEVGDVRWGWFSPKKGEGHKIYVIKQFDVKTEKGKHRVVFDSFILKKGKYVLDIADMDYSVKYFLEVSDPEPVNVGERL